MKKKFQIFIPLPNSLRITSKRILKSMNLRLENFFSVNFKNFSACHITNPRSFIIYNRGRRTKFHYGFNDLGARSRKTLNSSKHSGSGLPPLRSASMNSQQKLHSVFVASRAFWRFSPIWLQSLRKCYHCVR